MPENFCLACGRLEDSKYSKIGFCNYYGIEKHQPTHSCSWNHPHSRGTLEWRIESWREHADRLIERAKLLEEHMQSSERSTTT